MINISGISVTIDPFEDQPTLIGELYFDEWITTSFYQDEDGDILLLEWVDCDVEERINRYLLLYPQISYIKAFFNREINHRDLMLSCGNGLFFDQKMGETPFNVKYIASVEIPEEYLPTEDSFFDERLAISGYEQIIEFFNKFETSNNL